MKAEKFTNAQGEERIIVHFEKDANGNPTKAPFSCSVAELEDEADLIDSITFETDLKGNKAKEVLNLIKSVA